MNDNYSWSLGFGRWVGVPVRVHALFFLFIAVIFCVEWNHNDAQSMLLGTAIVTSLVLFVSVLIHELAHVFAISNLGGSVNTIVLTPWGGNSDLTLPSQPSSRTLVHLFGPFVNCAIFLLGAALLIQTNNADLESLINPFHPQAFHTATWEVCLLKIVTWINFQLMIVNLIPCFPFDGAGAVRSTVSSLNIDIPVSRVEAAVRVMGNAVALTMIGLAWLLRDQTHGPIEPIWFLLVTAGIALYFAARYSYFLETSDFDPQWDEMEMGIEHESLFDESSFFPLEHSENTAYSKWLVEKQEARMRDELRIEQEEQDRSDKILAKLHSEGMNSLSEEERSLLQRVSERIRRKRKLDVIE